MPTNEVKPNRADLENEIFEGQSQDKQSSSELTSELNKLQKPVSSLREITKILAAGALVIAATYGFKELTENKQQIEIAAIQGLAVKIENLGEGKFQLIFPSNNPFTPFQAKETIRAFMKNNDVAFAESIKYQSIDGKWSGDEGYISPFDQTKACILTTGRHEQ